MSKERLLEVHKEVLKFLGHNFAPMTAIKFNLVCSIMLYITMCNAELIERSNKNVTH